MDSSQTTKCEITQDYDAAVALLKDLCAREVQNVAKISNLELVCRHEVQEINQQRDEVVTMARYKFNAQIKALEVRAKFEERSATAIAIEENLYVLKAKREEATAKQAVHQHHNTVYEKAMLEELHNFDAKKPFLRLEEAEAKVACLRTAINSVPNVQNLCAEFAQEIKKIKLNVNVDTVLPQADDSQISQDIQRCEQLHASLASLRKQILILQNQAQNKK